MRQQRQSATRIAKSELGLEVKKIASMGRRGHPKGVPESGYLVRFPGFTYTLLDHGFEVSRSDGTILQKEFFETIDTINPWLFTLYLDGLYSYQVPEYWMKGAKVEKEPLQGDLAALSAVGCIDPKLWHSRGLIRLTRTGHHVVKAINPSAMCKWATIFDWDPTPSEARFREFEES